MHFSLGHDDWELQASNVAEERTEPTRPGIWQDTRNNYNWRFDVYDAGVHTNTYLTGAAERAY